MKVISFPDNGLSKPADGYKSPPCVSTQSGPPASQVVKACQPVITGESEAVRHFALTIAEKLLKDTELNQAAPFLVDKIVKMLIAESRCVKRKPLRGKYE